jgi:hypothetical protein
LQGLGNVVGDLSGAGMVRDQVPVDRRDPAGCGWVSLARITETGRVHAQNWYWPGVGAIWPQVKRGQRLTVCCHPAAIRRVRDRVPDRADLQGDQVIEPVTPVRSRGQAEPAAGRDLLDRVLERRCRNVVTLVGDHQPISSRQRADIVAAGEGLQCDDVDNSPDLRPAAAKLSWCHAEMVTDTGPPLICQCFAVHQHQGGGCVCGDHRAGDHCLAGTGRRHQRGEVVKPR